MQSEVDECQTNDVGLERTWSPSFRHIALSLSGSFLVNTFLHLHIKLFDAFDNGILFKIELFYFILEFLFSRQICGWWFFKFDLQFFNLVFEGSDLLGTFFLFLFQVHELIDDIGRFQILQGSFIM
jgi:hypothetical protein